ncbi:hypothetical protein FOMPIDRAFT_1037243 [Fomitopsis schrenkii]|uniref:VHS domain-containing protein n=1 Tax=Fomitopsis schrenkii TaxID=2126942 RepID=S8FB33_FOMSC|nr:hypothetical protein FOMPIDRAFT_1037243 [Fomitopsis schrenkii]
MKKLFGRDKSKTKVVPSDIGTGLPETYFSNANASQAYERSRSGTPQLSEEHWHVIESDAQSYSARSIVSASHSPPLASSTAPSHVSAPRALASLSPSPAAHKPSHRDRDRDQQTPRKKAANGHGHGGALAAVGILRALDPQLEGHNPSDSIIIDDNVTEASFREERKERRGFWERKDKEREKEKDRGRDRERDRERERERERLQEQEREREKDRGHEQERKDEDTPAQLTRMMGYLTATSSEDWSLVLEVCERASSSESSAKEAVKALRREFKYAEPSAQLSAARLWAIMLRNSSPVFTHQCTSRKFLDTLEDVISSSRTSPVVKARLLEVLAAAAYASAPGSKEAAFRSLWKKVKPADQPDDGVPIDASDAMFNPPTPRHMDHTTQLSDALLPSPRQVLPHKTRTSSRNQVIPPEEDMRRLFQECKVGRGNASLLSEALAFARPEDLKLKEIIREFYARCRASQELIAAQIPWAFAQAEKSRQASGRRGQPARVLRPSLDAHGRRRTDSQVSLSTISSSGELTQEEQLLAALLAANEDLMEALRLYDDLERVGIEREAEERSRKETRMNRNQLRYEDIDHSYLGPGETHHAGSSSRSPSPSSPSLSSAPSFVITTASPAAQPTHSHTHPLPPIPSPVATPTAKHHHAPPIATQGSMQSLAPPPHAPLGPRSPAHSNAPTSRTPSPERASLRHSAPRGSLDSVPGALTRDMSRLGVQNKDEADCEEPERPIRPSAKALGKRRQVDPTESEHGFDPDDIFYDHADDQSHHNNDDTLDSDSDEARHDPWHQPVHYIYDAAAERTKERLRAGRVSTAALVGGVH